MRLGIHLPQFRDPVAGEVLTCAARDAEAAGADDVWVSDHLILPPNSTRPPAIFHDALSVLTWAAAVTDRVRLGTSVIVAPYRHPVILAKALASLDALSGGRVICGIASGWSEDEFDALDVPFAERGSRTDETIEACRALWAGKDHFTWRGRRVASVSVQPGPAQPGGPPVWVGGHSDAAIDRAVRTGVAWHTTISDPDRLSERIDRLRDRSVAAGRGPQEVSVSVRVRATADDLVELVPQWRQLGVRHVLVDPPAFDARDFGAEVARLRRLVDAA